MPVANAFLSDRATVARMSEHVNPIKDLGAIEVRGIDTIKLAKLRAQVASKDLTEALAEFPAVQDFSDDGPLGLPGLASTRYNTGCNEHAEILQAAQRWATVDELNLEGSETQHVLRTLRQFVSLSCIAKQQQGKSVYLWTCL